MSLRTYVKQSLWSLTPMGWLRRALKPFLAKTRFRLIDQRYPQTLPRSWWFGSLGQAVVR